LVLSFPQRNCTSLVLNEAIIIKEVFHLQPIQHRFIFAIFDALSEEKDFMNEKMA
jgi:hypothetical protein